MPVGLLRRQRARPCGPPSGRISAVDARRGLLRRQRARPCGPPSGRISAVDARRTPASPTGTAPAGRHPVASLLSMPVGLCVANGHGPAGRHPVASLLSMPVGLLRRQRARPCGPPSSRISAVDARRAHRHQRARPCGPPSGRISAVDAVGLTVANGHGPAGRHPVASLLSMPVGLLRRQRARPCGPPSGRYWRERGSPLPLPSALYQGRQRVLAALHRRTGDGMPCARRSPGRRTALSTSPQ